jgi:hypothetical protein
VAVAALIAFGSLVTEAAWRSPNHPDPPPVLARTVARIPAPRPAPAPPIVLPSPPSTELAPPVMESLAAPRPEPALPARPPPPPRRRPRPAVESPDHHLVNPY